MSFTSSAGAEITFGPFGSGAGEVDSPQGVAVDKSTGRVYVVERINNRIQVFESDGSFVMAFGWGVADGTSKKPQTCTATCFPGIAGSGPGQFDSPSEIAIDNDPSSPSYRDVYVTERNRRLQKLSPTGEFILMIGGGVNKTTGGNLCTAVSGDTCGAGSSGGGSGSFRDSELGLAVGSGGVFYVADSDKVGTSDSEGFILTVEKFSPSGAFLEEVPLDGDAGPGTPTGRAFSFAADSFGSFYVATSFFTGTPTATHEAVHKYGPSGSLLYLLEPGSGPRALAVDSSDNVFAYARDVYAQDVNGNPIGAPSIAQYDSSGTLLRRFGYSLEENALGLAAYHTTSGEIFASEQSFDLTPEGHQLRHVSFPSPGPIIRPTNRELSGGTRPSEVRSARATFKTEINPNGKATTYHFEYIDQEGFESGGFANPATKSTPESAPIGSDMELHAVAAQVTGLSPATTYYLRTVATNSDGTAHSAPVSFETLEPLQIGESWASDVGIDSAVLHVSVNPLSIPAKGYFEYIDDETYQLSGFAAAKQAPDVTGGATALDFGSGESFKAAAAQVVSLSPDTLYHFRAVVSNSFVTTTGPEGTFRTFKRPEGGSTQCANNDTRTGASANLPDCRAYELVSPVDKNNGDVFPLGREGTARYFQSSSDGDRFTYSSLTAFENPESAPLFSRYLAKRGPAGWANEAIAPPRERTIPAVGGLPLLFDPFKAFSVDLSQGWVLHDSTEALVPNAVNGYVNLYRRDAGSGEYEALTRVKPPHLDAEHYIPELQGISSDSAKALIRAPDNLTPNAPSVANRRQLYEFAGGKLRLVSILPSGNASTLHSSAGTANSQVPQGFEQTVARAISADGSRIFWSTAETENGGPGRLYVRLNGEKTVAVSESVSGANAQFWTAAVDGSEVIFTIGADLESKGGDLYAFDVAAKTPSLIAHNVQGVVGASEDLSYLYFVSTDELAPDASKGKPNLYLYHENAFTFIGELTALEANGFSGRQSLTQVSPASHVARVTPDGRHLAFESIGRPTGYDNTDLVSGTLATEVYRYDADSDVLDCVSCNPTGTRPIARRLSPFRTVAGAIPPWPTQLYPSRVLSDDGSRLFFESVEALVPTDTNGVKDVYQWEAVGSGDCTGGSVTFSASAGGCVSLISTGKSASDSEFLDASASGSDVFILTASSLVPQDYGLIDVYNARVDGGFPPPPAPPAGCEGEACQGATTPPAMPTPASAVFSGHGNVAGRATVRKRCPKGRQRMRRAGKVRCVRPQRKREASRGAQNRRGGKR